MTDRYKRELNCLEKVYATALAYDVSSVAQMIGRIGQSPLLAVGSGGSYSTACFAADLHERRTGALSRAATPLDVIASRHPRGATLCFSASGRNRDIGIAFQISAQAESGPVGALVLSNDTPIHALQRRYSYADVAGGAHSDFKDGFLAVASMLASAILLTRAYNIVYGECEMLPRSLSAFAESAIGRSSFDFVADEALDVMRRGNLSLLYSPTMKAAAVDMESRFVEAALGSIHAADYRNFGHGRHHWIAKRGDETGIVAMVGERDEVLATRTLKLIPPEVPTWRIDVTGAPGDQSIAALIIGLHLSEAAGRVAKIDPGKPGVPLFGRKLYGLGPGALKRKTSDTNWQAAIRRKAPEALHNPSHVAAWKSAHSAAVGRWMAANVKGIVFDFDGTLCDGRNRYEPLTDDIASALRGLLERDIRIGVATGRGPSAGDALRSCLPEKSWPNVVMGYYNGAVLTSLTDQRDPLVDEIEAPELLHSLRTHPVLSSCEFRANAVQIALRLSAQLNTGEAMSAIDAVLGEHGFSARVTASSHSIDLQLSAASKCAVVDQLQTEIGGDGEVMRIGDKGVWPGNDSDLLDSPYGLSVDEASRHVTHCWALAPAGVKGVQATLYYLRSLQFSDCGARLVIKPGDRGDVYAT